jgi:hypothetical protein
MSMSVVERMIQGQTLAIECRLVGDDLTGDVPEITADPGVPIPDISLSVRLPDTVLIEALPTTAFLVGTHRLRLWINRSTGEREMAVEINLVVEAALDGFSVAALIIDGGAPTTEFPETIDGGEA